MHKPAFTIAWILIVLVGALAAAPARADDRLAAAKAELQRLADQCKASPEQTIAVDLVATPGKPATEPATPEEEARVKSLLESANLPYDPKNHRASYEFTLSMIRTRNVLTFALQPAATPEAQAPVRNCLAKLAAEVGLEHQFVDAAR